MREDACFCQRIDQIKFFIAILYQLRDQILSMFELAAVLKLSNRFKFSTILDAIFSQNSGSRNCLLLAIHGAEKTSTLKD